MKTLFSSRPRRRLGWGVTGLSLVVGALGLLAADSLLAASVTTIGGGSNLSKNPKYLGYQDGVTFNQALFYTPCGLAMDPSGNYLFVADRDNNAIRYLDLAAGQTWTLSVSSTNLINKPVGVVLDSSYNVYVLNRGTGKNGTVVTFDEYGEIMATNATSLTNACGITLDSVGNLFVTVQSNTIIKINPAGVRSTVATLPMTGTSLQGIVTKHNGLLAVCDAGRNGIYLVNPTNGIVTTNAGFHGAGDFLTNGNNVASSNTAKFYQPMNIAEAGDGTLIVSDYGNHRVKVVRTDGTVTNLYGVTSGYWTSSYYPGWSDGTPKVPDSTGTNVQSRMPYGVAFAPDGSVYTSEDYYHLIRHVTGAGFVLPPPLPPDAPVITSVLTNYNQITLSWTAAARATTYNVKRSPSSGGPFSTLATVTGTSYTDSTVQNGVVYYYVVSGLNSGVEGPDSVAVMAQAPYPPVPDPQIGYVDFPATTIPEYTSVFHSVSDYSFYNDAFIVIKGTPGSGTYYTVDGSNPSPTNSSVLSDYQDGKTPSQVLPYKVNQVAPSLTIKAIGAQTNHPNSAVVQATFQFIAGNPTIIGNNAAQFYISDITANAHLYYTLDGSDPSSTNAAAKDLGTVALPSSLWTVSLQITTNTLFKVRAYRDNYQPSAVVSVTFSPTNFQANAISFGFDSGEASSAFIASPGQNFYAPVTLSLLPNSRVYSLQFNLTVTNGSALTPPGAYSFTSMLVKPLPVTPVTYVPIPPAMFNSTDFTSLLITNSALNLLGVGWVERAGSTNLYDTVNQDLLQYSIAHDTMFLQSAGKVILGGYTFQVPVTALSNETYRIQIARPTATSDGIGAPGSDVYISAPTNGTLGSGAINAIKNVTIGQRKYIAGSVYPFRWFNAGDFGSSNLVNADVIQVFQSAIYSLDTPPLGSDFFDAMDSCGNLGALNTDSGDPNFGYFTNSFLSFDTNGLFGDTTTINQAVFGDEQLDVSDVYVTYRRSLDPSLTWYRRFWNNGQRVAEVIPNVAPLVLKSQSFATVQPKVSASSGSPQVNFAAGDIQGTSGQVLQVPITATVFGNYPLRTLMLNLTVVPLDGSPALTTPVQFNQVAAIGAPYNKDSIGNGNYSAVWLNLASTSLTGTITLGTLTVTVPAGAPANASYAIHFDHASASPNGIASFPKQTFTGLVTLSSRTNSSYNDGIPDSWRLRWFGTTNNQLSASNACPTGDGISNYKKYVAGVDPMVSGNFPSVNSKSTVPPGYTAAFHWPTVTGKKYAIERSSSLFPGSWSSIATNTGTGADMEFNDNAVGSSRYYRVRILP